MSKDKDHEFKIILLGESGVGKTSLTIRFTAGTFKSNSAETVVANFFSKVVVTQGVKCKLAIWDTAGQERYKAMVTGYYRKVDGVLLVYDVTNIMTFNQLTNWLSEIREYSRDATLLAVGNKIDHPNGSSVSRSVVKRFARDENIEFIETSAKTGENVEKIFEYLALKILQAKGVLPLNSHSSPASGAAPLEGAMVEATRALSFEEPATIAHTTTSGTSEATSRHETSTHALHERPATVAHTTSSGTSEATSRQENSTHALQDSTDLNADSSLLRSSDDAPKVTSDSDPEETTVQSFPDRAISETTFSHETSTHVFPLPPIVPLTDVVKLYVEKRRKLSTGSTVSLFLDPDDKSVPIDKFSAIKLHEPPPNMQQKPRSKCLI